LKDLGHDISDSTVSNILSQHAVPPAPTRKKSITWAQFIAAHKDVLCACDFFTKEVWTTQGLVTHYVLFFIHIASRKVHIAGFTSNPNEPWMKQIACNLTMAGTGFLDGIKYLVLDRDSKFTESFREILKSAGVEPLRLPPRTPNLNAFAERFVRSIKQECLDHLILFGEASLQRALDNFIDHYHHERPHQGKDNLILFPTTPAHCDSNPPRAGPVVCNQRFGGLLKFYHRKAANPSTNLSRSSSASRSMVGYCHVERAFTRPASQVRSQAGCSLARPDNLTIRIRSSSPDYELAVPCDFEKILPTRHRFWRKSKLPHCRACGPR
jgi:hypothetical protein